MVLAFSLTVIFLFFAFVWFYYGWFLRTPRRFPSSNPHAFHAPASGTVFSLFHTTDATIPIHKNHHKVLDMIVDQLGHRDDGYWVVSIMMTPLDVHIQRAPCACKTLSVSYRPWTFANAISAYTRQTAVWENEAQTLVCEREAGDRFAVIQIAWFLARKIIAYTQVWQTHSVWDPLGFIKLGSQVTVIFPWSYKPLVSLGQYVYDGETILAWME